MQTFFTNSLINNRFFDLKRVFQFCTFLLFSILIACTPSQPEHVNNLCRVFKQYPKWYWSAQKSAKKWSVPISTQMAIIHQESRFDATAKPDRTRLLWVIPWKRPSSAFGYSQALDQTWRNYQRDTGNHSGDRDEFKAATDFVGWYCNRAHKKLGLPSNDAKNLYLAYHEGIGGFQRKTYQKKPWLKHVANKVARRSQIYHHQLTQCAKSLPKKPWWRIG